MRRVHAFTPLFFLQVLPLILFPPSMLSGGLILIGVMVAAFLLLGFFVWRGRPWALTLSIFIQGFNVVIRLLMLFPNASLAETGVDLPYIVAGVLSVLISGWLLLRFDRPDIRATVTA